MSDTLAGPASIVQIGQLVQNSHKMNGNGTNWKQLSDRAEAERHIIRKFLDGHALLASMFHMYVATYSQMRDSFQSSCKESGQQVASQGPRHSSSS
jgi:hypothetical protein